MKYKLPHIQLLVNVALSAIIAITIISCSNDGTDHHEEPEIWASFTDIEFDYNDNVTKTVKIYGDVSGCQVYAGTNWLANSYLEYDELNVIVTENTSISSRTGNLFIFNQKGGNPITINVTQLGQPDTSGDNNGGNSGNNSGGNNGNTLNKLATPTGVAISNIGTNNNPVIQITWNPVPNATTYRVIKTYPKNGGYEIDGHYCSTAVVADTSIESAIDDKVESGTAYEYRVMAAGNGYKNSDWSATARINL